MKWILFLYDALLLYRVLVDPGPLPFLEHLKHFVSIALYSVSLNYLLAVLYQPV